MDAGRTHVYSGFDGSPIALINGVSADEHSGWSVAGVGDVNGDGFTDIAVGEPDASPNGLAGAGRVRVFAGPDASAVLLTLEGDQPGMHLGRDVAGPGDADRDGLPDVAASAPDHDGFYGVDAGLVYVYSGVTGQVIASAIGQAANDHFGVSIGGRLAAGADDRNELAVGAPSGSYEGSAGYGKLLALPQARVAGIGNGCGATIETTLPRLGELLTFSATSAPFGGLLLLSFSQGFFPTGTGCTFYVDLTALVLTLGMPNVDPTQIELELLVPDQPIFTGLDLYAQILAVQPTQLGYELTQTRRLTLGY